MPTALADRVCDLSWDSSHEDVAVGGGADLQQVGAGDIVIANPQLVS